LAGWVSSQGRVTNCPWMLCWPACRLLDTAFSECMWLCRTYTCNIAGI
jgi:hypothetical protein